MDIKNTLGGMPFKHGAQTILSQDATVDSNNAVSFSYGQPFHVSVSVGTIAVGLGQGVTLLANGSVTAGRRVYVTGFSIATGATAWDATGAGIISIQDSVGTSFLSWGTAIMTANAFALNSAGSVNVIYYSPFYSATGGTVSKGLRVYSTGSVTVGGNTATVSVWGFIK